ncbi:MAG: hypothetical protein GEU74_15160 [Nitriliruptorales bacterium]|nr:hypothetical protein [Nitriliruptorales bacterium]
MMTDEDRGGRRADGNLIVGLLCDPDLPDHIAHQLADELPELLSCRVSDNVTWQVQAVCDPFEAAESGDRVMDRARERVRTTDWDLVVCVTDLPLWSGTRPVIANVADAWRVALVSLPALGGFALRRRARDTVVPIIARLADGVLREDRIGAPATPQSTHRAGPARWVCPRDEDIDVEIVVASGYGHLRLLAGMVRANRPWKLAAGLSAALAGGMAGSAFGILYSNIWQLAAALHPLRLALVAVAACAVMVAYLVVGHRLWEHRSAEVPRFSRHVGLFNVATLATLGLGVLLFFAALLAIDLAAVALIIPPSYLHSVLGQPVGWTDYLTLAVMASAMGMVAGAVGSGLEADASVRAAAYGHREIKRREQLRRIDEDTSTSGR